MKRGTKKRTLKVGKRPELMHPRSDMKKRYKLNVKGKSTLKGNRFLDSHY